MAYEVVGEPENSPAPGAPRRFGVRIRLPDGLPRDDVRATLERAAREQQAKLNANALMVWAYRAGEPASGTYTVGMATIAPYGDWSRASERGPLAVTIDMSDEYFSRPK